MIRDYIIYPDNQAEQLHAVLVGQPTGGNIVDGDGRRLTGVTSKGVPGINATLVLRFEEVQE